MDAKERLAGAVFDSFDAMMMAYADEAVRAAAAKGERLDFSEASVAGVERCLAATGTATLPGDNLDTRLACGALILARWSGDASAADGR